MAGNKPRVAVHKFASCDGCQLAFLNLGEDLLGLAERVEIVHFAEAGPVDPEAPVDIAFVEGSLNTPEDLERIVRIRRNTRTLVTLGACANAGGLQALRNLGDGEGAWPAALYARPEHIRTLARVEPIGRRVKVDLELWGCPVDGRQVLEAVESLLLGVTPPQEADKLCLECKRRGLVCVLVARGEPCLGPVTREGCGALCPSLGRACYGCYGPAENMNLEVLAGRLEGQGLTPEAVRQRLVAYRSESPAWLAATGQTTPP